MEDDKKQPEEPLRGTWEHDKELSFKKVVPHLHTVADALRKTIAHEKAKLAQMVGARDAIRRK